MDPNQLATESAAAAFLIRLGLVLLAGLAGGGLIAILNHSPARHRHA